MTAHARPVAALATVALLAAVALAYAQGFELPAAEACRAVSLVDTASGRALRGAEDIAIDAPAGVALISVDDRWAVEDAIDAGAAVLPQGGIYALRLDPQNLSGDELAVEDLTTDFKRGRDFHPHGLALFNSGGQRVLFVVNHHRAQHDGAENAAWRRRPAVEVFALEGGDLAHVRTVEHATICRPNGIAALGPGRFLVTNDHGGCGALAARLEDLLPLSRSNLVHVDFGAGSRGSESVRVVAEGFRFANGVALGPEDPPRVYVADTRREAVFVYQLADLLSQADAAPVQELALESGPDNLEWLGGEHLLTGAHPRLLRLGLYLKRWFGVKSAPSRVIAIDPASGRVQRLFDDPDGALISGASTAAAYGRWLLIGSAAGPGLVICHLPWEIGPPESNL
jgi:sugar lactone lactonase YvrE